MTRCGGGREALLESAIAAIQPAAFVGIALAPRVAILRRSAVLRQGHAAEHQNEDAHQGMTHCDSLLGWRPVENPRACFEGWIEGSCVLFPGDDALRTVTSPSGSRSCQLPPAGKIGEPRDLFPVNRQYSR
jgi:hypothetical protein